MQRKREIPSGARPGAGSAARAAGPAGLRPRPSVPGRIAAATLLGLALLTALPGPTPAQAQGRARPSTCTDCGPATADTTCAACDTWFRLIPPRITQGGVVAVPKASYSEDTGLGLGAEILKPFCLPGAEGCSRLSDVSLRGRGTFEGQVSAEIETNLIWADDRYSLKAKARYSDTPRHFWGVGPSLPDANEESYQPRQMRAYVEVFRQIYRSLKVGLRYEYEQVEFLQVEPGGLLDSQTYRGLERSAVAGTGALLEIDLRDRRFAPRRGIYYQAFGLFFDEELGSEHDFNNYSVDLRHYYALAGDHVLATQFFAYAAKGRPPIWRYASLGGRNHTRGYPMNRYMDRVLVAFQAEYRMPVYWRMGLAFFGGLGDVAARGKDLRLDSMRPTLGAGLRLGTGPDDAINVSFDVAFGEMTPRLYLYIGDSF